ncbi:MAG: DUF2802 domain-containing protein [Gammaproteobacteria bacterium]|jgi:hypothetical protein|nr:DUF2802 domain-containing protein [Gammaproteobacteria bacterium]
MLDTATAIPLAVLVAALMAVSLLALRSVRRLGGALAQAGALKTQAEAAVGELAAKVAALEVRLDAAGTALAEAGDRLRLLGQRIDILESRQPTHGSYDDAIRLVRQGAAAGRLVEELGLSAMEAELIAQLHGTGSESPAAARPRRRASVN